MTRNNPPAIGPQLRQVLAAAAAEQDLLLLGIVELGPETRYTDFQSWLAAGHHADMHYMEEHQHCRADPRELLPDAQTAVILAMPYDQGDRLPARRGGSERPRIAQYARLRDYHRTLREAGTAILNKLIAEAASLGETIMGRVTVDSAPLLERALAARTAEGFIGKNSLYIHPRYGSLLLLAEILVTYPLPADPPASVDPSQRQAAGGCGSCRRCQVHCPTGALQQDYTVDARRCLAYYTIEHRGTIPLEFWPWLAVYLFGCDICQLACPYNRGHKILKTAAFNARRVEQDVALADLATMSQSFYEQWAGGTPLTRAKRDGLRRNALIAMVVTRDPQLPEVLATLASDPSPLLQATIAQIGSFQPHQL